MTSDGDVLDLESPPVDHIVADEEISNVNMPCLVMMLRGADDRQSRFIIKPQRWGLV